MPVSPYSCECFVSAVVRAKEPIVGMCFWYQASHPSAVAMGGGALLMSMEGRVASLTEDPERAVLLRMVWCLIMTLETVGVCGACAFGLSDEWRGCSL